MLQLSGIFLMPMKSKFEKINVSGYGFVAYFAVTAMFDYSSGPKI